MSSLSSNDDELDDAPANFETTVDPLSPFEATLDYLFPSQISLLEYIRSGLLAQKISSSFYADLLRKVVFTTSGDTPLLFSPIDFDYLTKNKPTFSFIKKDFMEICGNFSSYIESGLTTDIPNPEQTWTAEKKIMLNYITAATMSLYVPFDSMMSSRRLTLNFFSKQHYETLRSRSSTHGETFNIVNIWGPILDVVFLSSKLLTLDR